MFDAEKIVLGDVRTQQRFVTWHKAAGAFYNISHHSRKMDLDIARVLLNSNSTTTITGADATLHNDNGYTKIVAPEIKIATGIHSTDFSRLQVQSLSTDEPQITIYSKGNAAEKSSSPKNLQAAIDNLNIRNARVHYTKINGEDTTRLQTKLDLDGSRMVLNTRNETALQYTHLLLNVTPLELRSTATTLSIPTLSLLLSNGQISKNQKKLFALTSGVNLKWQEAQLLLHHADTMELAVSKLSGMFNDATFSYRQQSELPWEKFVENTTIHEGAFNYRNKQLHANAASFKLDPSTHTFYGYNYGVTPNMSAAETFQKARWQRDYITVKGDALQVSGIHLSGDSALSIRKITVDKAALTTARDKRIPFEHGIEKYMPTKLIRTIPFALQVDSIVLQESAVTVNESSKTTSKWAAVPITEINALITHFGNVYNDSLHLQASGKLLGNPIRYFSYNESYHDTLSGFDAQSNLAPMDLKDFNAIAIPMAAVKVKRGHADTIYSAWSGNKYATLGTMNFHYRQLKVQVLNKKDSSRQGFMAHLKTLLANTFIRNGRQQPTRMYFVRDREKFIFNYWVKAETSGIATATGIKKSRKFLRKYNKAAKKYALPKR